VIAVLMIDDAADAVPVARALLAGGVDCIELTLRTPVAMESLHRIRAEVPEMVVGVGTILNVTQVNEVKAAGAAFGVAPGMNPRVVVEALRVGLPFSPGICTPTDIELAIEQGCRLLKFFPSEPSGGLAYLRTIAAPFAHLGVKYIPLGGVGAANAGQYLKEPSVHALGGSWLAPRDLIQRKDWNAITANAAEAAGIVKLVRGGAA
jgi:2-dehydro-3-deoxyphosphogluconate aldolase/(4S)-4-hydroxy-2-oxoglutarate aldolase